MNSMTKAGAIVAQSFGAGRGFAKADTRIAARVSPEYSTIRLACGHPLNPRNTPAPIAIAANAAAAER